MKHAVLADRGRALLRARRRRLHRACCARRSPTLPSGAGQGASDHHACRSRATSSCPARRRSPAKSTRCCWRCKIESELTKDQILEVYMNQIFLGQRAYGFAAAAQIYFGKPLEETSPWPRRPCWPACRRRRRPTTRWSTRSAPRCASSTCWTACSAAATITRRPVRGAEARTAAKSSRQQRRSRVHAEYVAEMARQLVYEPVTETRPTRAA